ncbi:uncharacterized protein A4U43_C01F13600 [Asparagus officinalis]|uniref:EH domain-containing protein n=1 Tax=Asparagus officinalis TaxID=4686 RepID=A0A5P1FQS0_ASPOF|nr:uncharacterized protein A4U43_C01F13600 [Asparagus officinalis]
MVVRLLTERSRSLLVDKTNLMTNGEATEFQVRDGISSSGECGDHLTKVGPEIVEEGCITVGRKEYPAMVKGPSAAIIFQACGHCVLKRDQPARPLFPCTFVSSPNYEDEFLPPKKRKTSRAISFPPSSSSPNYEDEFLPPKKRKTSRANYSSRNAQADRWRDRADEMGLTHHKLYLPNKRVTRSDTNPNQHRFQLTQTDIDKSNKALRDIANQAKFEGVDVNIMDDAGNTYEMVFKYVTSSKTYRFMGPQYTEFLKKSKLKANEVMNIWGLTRDDGENRHPWLAFVTT